MSFHIDQVWGRLLDNALLSPKTDAQQDSIREIIGAHVVLDGSMEQFCLNERRKLSPIYASAELLWYLSRTHDASMICAYAPQYKQFCEGGRAYGAYGGRLANNLRVPAGAPYAPDLLDEAVFKLSERGTTKKCVVSLWRPDDLVASNRDIPCTLTWQFLLRGERLHMVCSMRSNDLWKGFLYDCYVNTVIQRYVAARLGVTAGDYHHFAGSLHLYERDVEKAKEALPVPRTTFEPYHPGAGYWSEEELDSALATERSYRMLGFKPQGKIISSVLGDAVICCCRKWYPDVVWEEIRAPGLRHAMLRHLTKTKEQYEQGTN